MEEINECMAVNNPPIEEQIAPEEKKKDYKAEVITDILNVRSAPSSTANVISQFHKGDVIEPVEYSVNEDWIKVKTSHVEGWVMARFIKEVES